MSVPPIDSNIPPAPHPQRVDSKGCIASRVSTVVVVALFILGIFFLSGSLAFLVHTSCGVLLGAALPILCIGLVLLAVALIVFLCHKHKTRQDLDYYDQDLDSLVIHKKEIPNDISELRVTFEKLQNLFQFHTKDFSDLSQELQGKFINCMEKWLTLEDEVTKFLIVRDRFLETRRNFTTFGEQVKEIQSNIFDLHEEKSSLYLELYRLRKDLQVLLNFFLLPPGILKVDYDEIEAIKGLFIRLTSRLDKLDVKAQERKKFINEMSREFKEVEKAFDIVDRATKKLMDRAKKESPARLFMGRTESLLEMKKNEEALKNQGLDPENLSHPELFSPYQQLLILNYLNSEIVLHHYEFLISGAVTSGLTLEECENRMRAASTRLNAFLVRKLQFRGAIKSAYFEKLTEIEKELRSLQDVIKSLELELIHKIKDIVTEET
ncbi:IncA family protein [Chlamydia pneumoniae LPCoLN]|uniref:IncA family protein n=1 Tax=Chlamydia pneumoniae TaxID=83558 RepID=UPI0001BD9CFB|nr:IncA family protein [Chlamydia pneumoniae]ACZ33188.1 IncA family protein [Chlamydia pneumoniae LPCoLN]ETR80092.1 hypothetical protein X556_0582 [Chlamydia pneumoniae B21]